MSHDAMITIHADILQITDDAVLLACAGEEIWLPLSQIDFAGKVGDADVPVSLPEWLADENGLADGDGMSEPAADAPPAPAEPEQPETVTLTEDNDDPDTDEAPNHADTAFIKTETITVSVPLDPAERESVGDRMASALEKIAELEDDLDIYRKRVNAQIKSLQKDAETARKEWQEGCTEQEVYCDVLADYDQEAIVWIDHDNNAEVKRRPMTAEERQYRLPIPRPGDGATAPAEPAGEHPDTGAPHAAPTPGLTHTCLDCAHMIDGENGQQAEACAACVQSSSGDADNWTPRRECRTCAHSHATIDMPPCKGCALNVMPEHRGDSECWEWADAAAE